jgi:UDP-N-acetylmuramoyl-L-alanyl-D-glutamate--2,6-diaminopimelate ligase
VSSVVELRLQDLCSTVESHSSGQICADVIGSHEVTVTGIADNSGLVKPGDLFVCLVGEHHDGHDHAVTAVATGARAVLVQRRIDVGCPQILVTDTRLAVGQFAAAICGYPSQKMMMIGITGTNGKTTTAHLVAAMLEAIGHKVRVLGTLSGTFTTPEAVDLQGTLAQWRAEGCTAVVMEVSSHALALHRVDGTVFDLVAFTNLGRDHLDLHQSMEAYFRAKARLFSPEFSAKAVINTADIHGALMADGAEIDVVAVDQTRLSEVTITFDRIEGFWGDTRISLPLGGQTNLPNLLLALEVAEVLGVEPAAAAQGLANLKAIPGRFEVVAQSQPGSRPTPTVIVDFAHTPEGLEQLLRSVRAIDKCERVLLVFGCGGDRDREKRPRMGSVATDGADLVFLTSDNPRSEEPRRIIDEIRVGIEERHRGRVVVEPDRRHAIAAAIASATPRDVVLIAGKGHETTQTIAGRVVRSNDAEIVREILGGTPGAQR